MIWKSVPSQLARENKKFIYKVVKLCIRFSLDNLKLEDDVLNIPLFMAD